MPVLLSLSLGHITTTKTTTQAWSQFILFLPHQLKVCKTTTNSDFCAKLLIIVKLKKQTSCLHQNLISIHKRLKSYNQGNSWSVTPPCVSRTGVYTLLLVPSVRHALAPLSTDYLQPSYDQLRLELYQGSVTQKDARFRGFDLVTSIEL